VPASLKYAPWRPRGKSTEGLPWFHVFGSRFRQ